MTSKTCSNEMIVKIISVENLRGYKEDNFSAFIKVSLADLFTFNTKAIETNKATLNFVHEIKLEVDEHTINKILNENIQLTLIEALPKEKFAELGTYQTNIGSHFLPIHQIDPLSEIYPKIASTKYEKTITVKLDGVPVGKGKDPIKDKYECQIQMEILFAKPLLIPELMYDGRFILFPSIVMHSCPEDWVPKEDGDQASCQYTFMASITLPGLQKEYAFKSDNQIMSSKSKLGDIEAVYVNSAPHAMLDESDVSIKCISWSSGYAIYLDNDEVNKLRKSISEKNSAEITIKRELKSSASTEAIQKSSVSFEIDLKLLTFMKVVGIRGSVSASVIKDSNKKEVGSSTLSFQIGISRPLTEKKVLPPITKKVSDYIQKRVIPESQLNQKQAEKVKEAYMTEIQEAVTQLALEYNTISKECSGDKEVFHPKFLNSINEKGIYYQIKERLKKRVIDIVKEVYQKKSNFASKAELHHFMTDLYVHLLDTMNEAVEKIFSPDQLSLSQRKQGNQEEIEQLRQYAELSEQDFDISAAQRYYLEKIARNEESVISWYQYASFCMRNRMHLTGEESFREILTRNPRHVNTLLAYGALCHMNNRLEEARVYFDTAIKIQPKGYLGYSLMGLFYSSQEDDEHSENSLIQAQDAYLESHPDITHETCLLELLLDTAQFLISISAYPLAQEAIAKGLLLATDSSILLIQCANLELQMGNYEEAMKITNDLLIEHYGNYKAWAFAGTLYMAINEIPRALDAFESSIAYAPEHGDDIYSIYYKLAKCLLVINNQNSYQRIKQLFLLSCEMNPSSLTWLGTSKICKLLGEVQESEEALMEANILNNRDVNVWSEIALFYLSRGKNFEATKAVYQALKHGLDNSNILRTLGDALYNSSEYAVASECFKIALENIVEPTTEVGIEASMNLINELETSIDKAIKATSMTNISISKVPLDDRVVASSADLYSARSNGFSA